MRTTFIGVAVLLAGSVAVFSWQRSQIARLRGQMAQQAADLADNQKRVADLSVLVTGTTARPVGATPATLSLNRADRPSVPAGGVVLLRADERRLILNQYQDVLAEMNLPPETATRLQYLLADRVEAVLDAQDAATREGFAEGSADMARAVTLAIGDVDRDIANLLGPDGNQRFNGLLYGTPPAAPAPPAAVTVVNNTVIEQAPAAAPAAASYAAPDDAYVSAPSYPYYSYPVATAFYVVDRRHEPARNFRQPGVDGSRTVRRLR
jgi:hypothetical protein